MVSSARQAITCILLVLGTAVFIQAQTTTQKVARASISGKVTIKGKPAVGVMVLAKDSNEHRIPVMVRYSATTDQIGSYRITNLPAGTYDISAITPALVPANEPGAILISEGEEVEDVNLSLVPGGVITGRITDSEGEPLIGQLVIIKLDERLTSGNRRLWMRLYSPDRITDDRGVYRAFGLPPGKYKVSVGDSDSGRKSSRQYHKETFYPSVTDPAKATIIEVTEGSEKNNVDIVMGRPVGTFRVAGRVVDGETGKPIPNMKYGVGQRIVHDQNSSSSSSTVGRDFTNANGEFKLENVSPGPYTIFTVAADGSDVPAASVTFEVVDRDLTDLLITTTKGGSLSGVVVLQGSERAPSLLSHFQICASVQSKDSDFTNPPASGIGQDGTFRIEGVRSGLARLSLCYADNQKQFEIIRVERNGIPQAETINVNEREHVAGLRVLVKYVKMTGAIRGQLKVEDGELPPISQLWLSLWPLDENLQPRPSHSLPSPKLDARGRFFAEGLPAGTYRLRVSVIPSERTSGRSTITDEIKQEVTVADDTVTEVTLIIKRQPDPN